MPHSTFASQPALVKVAVGLTAYNSFAFFEELVIDRYGLWRYLPSYRFARLCPWDLGAVLVIAGALLAAALLRRGTKPAKGAEHPLWVKLAVGLMWTNALLLGLGILGRYGLWDPSFLPAVAIPALAIIAGVAAWVRRRPASMGTFRQQPFWVQISSALALGNLCLFLAFVA